jgi:predicted DCC family thiol-disulfide oxidoreductase YuxK
MIPFNMDPRASDTIILLRNNKLYIKSRAALEIIKELTGLWPLLYGLIIVPPFIRNFFYSILAKNRYKWFGKMDACMVPSGEIRNRFIS